MDKGHRATAPAKLIKACPHLKAPLIQGDLHVLRVKLKSHAQGIGIDIGSPKHFGEQDVAWLKLRQSLSDSASCNLVIVAPVGKLRTSLFEIAATW